MSEEFAVDGPFGDGTAVHGEIRTVFAGGVGVYDLREVLLADAALARDEDAEVGQRDLHRHLNVAIEQGTVAYNPEPLLDCQ